MKQLIQLFPAAVVISLGTWQQPYCFHLNLFIRICLLVVQL